jgi:hypothetical protein
MFRSTGLLAGICLALFIVYTPVAKAQGDNLRDAGVVTAVPQEIPDGIVGYRTEDGGKTWIPIKEEKGIAERIPSGTTKAEFMAAHKMSPEAEAAIVHQAPPVPVIIDGILYEPEQIHLFDGKQLGFTVGSDGELYAFTSPADLESFISEQMALPLSDPPEHSLFCEDPYYCGQHQQTFPPGTTVFSLNFYQMNDMISSMKISLLATNGCTLFEHDNLQGDYFAVGCGALCPNLAWDFCSRLASCRKEENDTP